MNTIHAARCATHDKNYVQQHEIPRDCDCDGYHTFAELYNHRITLFIALCRYRQLVSDAERTGGSAETVWRSMRHSDGELCFGTGTQFVLGIGTEKGRQITYHIPIERWDEASFAVTFEMAPEWDGHSSDDVIARLKSL